MSTRLFYAMVIYVTIIFGAFGEEVFCRETHSASCDKEKCISTSSDRLLSFQVDFDASKFTRCVTIFGNPNCFKMKIISISQNPFLRYIVVANENMTTDQVIISIGSNESSYQQAALGKDGSIASRGTCSVVK